MAKKKLVIEKHDIMPKHTICSDKETQSILEEYSSTREQFPKISINDAALATFKVKLGDMIKIERNDPQMGKILFYRVVSDE